jgi:hypothetical protein
MTYKINFNLDVAYPKGRISRKTGTLEVNTIDEVDTQEMKEDGELKMLILHSIQPKIKTGKIFNVEITTIKIQ